MSDQEAQRIEVPAGEYAIVEILGHRTIVGRITEVERFGANLMSIEPLFNGTLLDAVLIGGASIYQFTPCSAATALKRQPTDEWQLPASVRAVLPDVLLPAPEFAPAFLVGEDDDNERPRCKCCGTAIDTEGGAGAGQGLCNACDADGMVGHHG